MANADTLSDGISLNEATHVNGKTIPAHLKVKKDYTDDSEGEVINTLMADDSGPRYGHQVDNQDGPSKHEDTEVVIEQEALVKPLMYRISQRPPIHLLLLFSFQQSLLSISSPLAITLIAAEVICAQRDEQLKLMILSASFFMTGISTIAMSTFGVRLPVFQGPAAVYLIPLLVMSSMPEWKCPATFTGVNPVDNSSVTMVYINNMTAIPARELILRNISGLSGSLMLAGCLHCLIGATGLVGVILRFVGPVTIVPAITLVGIFMYTITVTLCETNWAVAFLTAAMTIVLSFYLESKQTPIPFWSSSKGFHIVWFPFHQAFSVLLSIVFGWILSAILTEAGALSNDPNSKQYFARTDSRLYIIKETDWFIFPYPGKLGPLSFNAAAFISFFVATIMSVLDSIGDYNAVARATRVPPPPTFAFNRGVSVEGLMSILSGAMGSCHATISYGGNIGAIKLTGVASRSVFQLCGLIYIFFAIFGKVGALFVTIPYCVLGGVSIIINGMFIGLVLSYLQFVDMNSTRNLAIIGSSLLVGLIVPYWVAQNPTGIDTGNFHANNLIQVVLINPSFVGGVFACFLDNTIPGTLKERGLLHQLKELNDEDAKLLSQSFEDGEEVYRLPYLPEAFTSCKLAKYLPFMQYTGK